MHQHIQIRREAPRFASQFTVTEVGATMRLSFFSFSRACGDAGTPAFARSCPAHVVGQHAGHADGVRVFQPVQAVQLIGAAMWRQIRWRVNALRHGPTGDRFTQGNPAFVVAPQI